MAVGRMPVRRFDRPSRADGFTEPANHGTSVPASQAKNSETVAIQWHAVDSVAGELALRQRRWKNARRQRIGRRNFKDGPRGNRMKARLRRRDLGGSRRLKQRMKPTDVLMQLGTRRTWPTRLGSTVHRWSTVRRAGLASRLTRRPACWLTARIAAPSRGSGEEGSENKPVVRHDQSKKVRNASLLASAFGTGELKQSAEVAWPAKSRAGLMIARFLNDCLQELHSQKNNQCHHKSDWPQSPDG